jgi:hypothetical protein
MGWIVGWIQNQPRYWRQPDQLAELNRESDRQELEKRQWRLKD